MMRTGTRRSPPRPLPPRHTHNLRRWIQGNHAVDFAIGVQVVLAAVDVFAVHVHGRDAKEVGLFAWRADTAAPVLRAVDFVCCEPGFVVFEAVADYTAERVVEGSSGAVGVVESCFEGFAGGSKGWSELVWSTRVGGVYKSSTSVKNSAARVMSFCWLGWMVIVEDSISRCLESESDVE